ncbi:MAG: signal peptidase I [Oscillospiraceae bacterium]|nr:signal peptidase I [Oscillospiraceae bacterium]
MKKLGSSIFNWLKTFAIAIIIGLIVNHTLIASAVIISSSMEGTIMTNSRVMGLRVAYTFRDPGRFDIILFEPPDGTVSVPFVKRIIGLPYETVTIVNGEVFINDASVPLYEPFLAEDMRGSYGPFVVPGDSFFVMGDNRNRSNDSRHWNNSFVSRDDIIGRLYFEFFPNPQILS